MSEFTVHPQALTLKAGYDEDRAGVIEGLQTQINQARASEDCFGLIGQNAGFFTGYDEMVTRVEENVGKAAEYLHSSADRLNASAEQYGVIEQGYVQAFGATEAELGNNTFGSTSAWDAKTPGVDSVDAGKKAVEAVGNFQSAQTLPQVFVAGVGVKREVDDLLAHPMASFWDNGLGFLVEWCMYPLRPLFEQVTGDPDQMRTTATGWEKMSAFVTELADADVSEQEGLGKHWTGEASTKQNKQKVEFQDGLRALADTCLQLKEHLNQIADFFEGLWDILVDIVRETVESLIITWLAALATSAISFGSSVAAAWSVTVARFSVTLSKILMNISKALRWLVRMLDKLKRLKKLIEDTLKAQSMMVRLGARALGVRTALRYLDPMRLGVMAVTGLTGQKPTMAATDSATDLATDTALQEAGEEATGEHQRNENNTEAMDRGFS